MGNPQVTDTQLAWLAGIIDGEGTITVGFLNTRETRQYAPSVTVVNTNPVMIATILAIYDQLGVGSHVMERDRTKSLGKRSIWNVTVQRMGGIEKLLTVLAPFMVAKRAQAELLLRFVRSRIPKKNSGSNRDRTYTQEELDMCLEIRNLNDFTPGSEMEKIKSELQGNLQRLAEMPSPTLRYYNYDRTL